MNPYTKSRPDFSKDSSYGRSYARAHRMLFVALLIVAICATSLPFLVTYSPSLAIAYFGYVFVAASGYKWGIKPALLIGSVIVFANSYLLMPFIEDTTLLQWSALSTAVAFIALAVAFGRVGRVATDLRQIRFSDQLQSMTNRDTFVLLLEKEVARVKRYRQHCSLAMVELGILDKVEKVHGHHQADLLLRQFQMKLGRQIRKCDTLSWIGGPYLALLLPNTPMDGAESALERLKSSGLEIVARSSLRLRPEASDWRVAVGELDEADWDAYTTLNRFAQMLGPNVGRRIGIPNNTNRHAELVSTSTPAGPQRLRHIGPQLPQSSVPLRTN